MVRVRTIRLETRYVNYVFVQTNGCSNRRPSGQCAKPTWCVNKATDTHAYLHYVAWIVSAGGTRALERHDQPEKQANSCTENTTIKIKKLPPGMTTGSGDVHANKSNWDASRWNKSDWDASRRSKSVLDASRSGTSLTGMRLGGTSLTGMRLGGASLSWMRLEAEQV
ncbi:hypothetical protein BaRGS_00040379 [Batillaria attramentaria]|uniref:Uncharacterized protein n=1 Tax=Batillaria attramentaria TaxID=370345 RepID=A0ABD0J0Q4_9CAEN